jgi:type VI protein secretion system component VasF
MSKLSRDARRRIYEEERARLAEEQRQADERAVATMSPEERKKIHHQETDRRRSTMVYVVLAVLGLAVAYYYGMEHLHEGTRREAQMSPELRKLDTEIMGRPSRTREDLEALERWMPWRW